MAKNNAKLFDPTILIQAGINPRTGLPVKFDSMDGTKLVNDTRALLRVMDEQVAINRYTWYNLPDGLDGELLERILYYRGQGAFFYMEADDRYYFLPYALAGGIDVYGRYRTITPLPFAGPTATTDSNGKSKAWIEGLTKKPQYSPLFRELTWSDFTDSCVLLFDYTKQLSQTVIPRSTLNDGLCNLEAECLAFMRTCLLSSTGIKGLRVTDADQAQNVDTAATQIEQAAKSGKPWIPVVGALDFQELTDGSSLKGADYMQAMQSIDNLRLSTYGLENGGLFEKKSHMLETEQALNGGTVGLVMQDGLRLRQNFCTIVNSIWGLGIWCDVSESAIGLDKNLDGGTTTETQGGDTNDQSLQQ